VALENGFCRVEKPQAGGCRLPSGHHIAMMNCKETYGTARIETARNYAVYRFGIVFLCTENKARKNRTAVFK